MTKKWLYYFLALVIGGAGIYEYTRVRPPEHAWLVGKYFVDPAIGLFLLLVFIGVLILACRARD